MLWVQIQSGEACFLLFFLITFLSLSTVSRQAQTNLLKRSIWSPSVVITVVPGVYVMCHCLCFTAPWWMCRAGANRVYMWAAQRPYPASMGNISCYKGTDLSSGTRTVQTLPVTPTQNITPAQSCFLLLITFLTCVSLWQVQCEEITICSLKAATSITFSVVYSIFVFVLVPKGETKQCKEWLLRLDRWQRVQYDSWWTSAAGIILPYECRIFIMEFDLATYTLNQ